MTNLADLNQHNFYHDEFQPYKPTEKYPNGFVIGQFQDNNSENYLFIDGSILSNAGVYREMNYIISPIKDMEISITETTIAHNFELNILDNKSNLALHPNNYSNRVTVLNQDGTCHLKESDEQGFNESRELNGSDIQKHFNNLGLDVNKLLNLLENKSHHSLQNDSKSHYSLQNDSKKSLSQGVTDFLKGMLPASSKNKFKR